METKVEKSASSRSGTLADRAYTEFYPEHSGIGKVHLETKNLHIWFGEKLILKNVDLSFPENSVTALIGPSGCGKSTFIRVLNRMHEFIPTAGLAGDVLYDGQSIYDKEVDPVQIRVKIGMVFQKPNPFPSMTISENVLSGLRLAQIKIENPDEIVESCLQRASLWAEVKDRLNANASELSGGQQQRLCIARSLAVNPEVLLMDEPCSALDPGSTKRVEETIHELSKEMTVIIVTHNMQQAQRVSDYTAFLLSEDGTSAEVVEHGSTKDVFTTPKDSRTNDYVNGRFG
jgi:phosphate transport system ATP-binding protein